MTFTRHLLPAVAATGLVFASTIRAQDEVAASKPAAVAKPAPVKIDQSAPGAVIRSIMEHMKAGKPAALWSGVAPDDRQTIQSIVTGTISKIDPGVYNEMAGLVGKVGKLLDSNAMFMANNKMINADGKPEEMVASIKSASKVIGSLLAGDLGTHEKASKMNIEQLILGTGAPLVEKMMGMSGTPGSPVQLPDFEKVEIGQAIMKGDDKAAIPVTVDGDTEEVPMRLVDGKWYFDIADDLAEAAKEVEKQPKMNPQQAMQIKMMVGGMVGNMLKPFEDVESQEEFDDAVEQMMGMMRMFMGGMGGGPGGGGGFGR